MELEVTLLAIDQKFKKNRNHLLVSRISNGSSSSGEINKAVIVATLVVSDRKRHEISHSQLLIMSRIAVVLMVIRKKRCTSGIL
jgi:hypothetical protein